MDVSQIILHPSWDANTFDNDIAVLRLAESVIQRIADLAIWDGPVGGDLLVAGWGAIAEGGAGSQLLRRVSVPLVSQADCNDAASKRGREGYGSGFDAPSRKAAWSKRRIRPKLTPRRS